MKIVEFMKSNYLYLIWFVLYFTLAWGLLGASLNSFILVSIAYAVSITVALSPVGEFILRIMVNCREIATEQERDYLIPIFEEVYENAKEIDPELSNDIKLYIMDAMYINAYAIGRKTIAVTQGAIETFTEDELKGFIAHEFGHMKHGHSKALLLSRVGNFIFSIIAWVFMFFSRAIEVVSNIVAQFNLIGIIFSIFAFIIRIFIELSIFVFVHLSEIILALNSRANELEADEFAHSIGYGRELTAGLYILHKISIHTKPTIMEKLKATHPHIPHRIKKIEILENQVLEG